MPGLINLVYAHPYPDRSRANRALLARVRDLPGLEVRSLYDLYPDFDVDVDAEREALVRADVVVWQCPFYWYGMPALLHQWIEKVLGHGWAYGAGGTGRGAHADAATDLEAGPPGRSTAIASRRSSRDLADGRLLRHAPDGALDEAPPDARLDGRAADASDAFVVGSSDASDAAAGEGGDVASDAFVIGSHPAPPQVRNQGGPVLGAPVLTAITYDGYDLRAVAEDIVATIGVVLMLFLIGLELDPKRLFAMRRSVFGVGRCRWPRAGACSRLGDAARDDRRRGRSWPASRSRSRRPPSPARTRSTARSPRARCT